MRRKGLKKREGRLIRNAKSWVLHDPSGHSTRGEKREKRLWICCFLRRKRVDYNVDRDGRGSGGVVDEDSTTIGETNTFCGGVKNHARPSERGKERKERVENDESVSEVRGRERKSSPSRFTTTKRRLKEGKAPAGITGEN